MDIQLQLIYFEPEEVEIMRSLSCPEFSMSWWLESFVSLVRTRPTKQKHATFRDAIGSIDRQRVETDKGKRIPKALGWGFRPPAQKEEAASGDGGRPHIEA